MTSLTQQVMTDPNSTRKLDGFSVNFLSWNVKSLNHPVKRKKVFTHLKQLKPEIAFLHETHLRTTDLFRIKQEWSRQVYHSKSKVIGGLNVSFKTEEESLVSV